MMPNTSRRRDATNSSLTCSGTLCSTITETRLSNLCHSVSCKQDGVVWLCWIGSAACGLCAMLQLLWLSASTILQTMLTYQPPMDPPSEASHQAAEVLSLDSKTAASLHHACFFFLSSFFASPSWSPSWARWTPATSRWTRFDLSIFPLGHLLSQSPLAKLLGVYGLLQPTLADLLGVYGLLLNLASTNFQPFGGLQPPLDGLRTFADRFRLPFQ